MRDPRSRPPRRHGRPGVVRSALLRPAARHTHSRWRARSAQRRASDPANAHDSRRPDDAEMALRSAQPGQPQDPSGAPMRALGIRTSSQPLGEDLNGNGWFLFPSPSGVARLRASTVVRVLACVGHQRTGRLEVRHVEHWDTRVKPPPVSSKLAHPDRRNVAPPFFAMLRRCPGVNARSPSVQYVRPRVFVSGAPGSGPRVGTIHAGRRENDPPASW